jgi:KaiC/GvpD/RAD55 family RecA-like ATPase
MQEILDAVERTGAQRLVIDSLVGFEMALAPGFREDFRESLYRMIAALTGAGVTILTTGRGRGYVTGLPFSQYVISFLTDDIIRMRYVEIDGQLRKVMVIIKMRGGNHSKDIREYVITGKRRGGDEPAADRVCRADFGNSTARQPAWGAIAGAKGHEITPFPSWTLKRHWPALTLVSVGRVVTCSR